MTDGRTQRRSDYRAEVSYPVWYRPLPAFSDTKASWHTSTTQDLSAGGMFFPVDAEVDLWSGESELLEIQLFLPTGPIFLLARPVRQVDTGNGNKAAAVQFVSLAPGDKEKIARVVLSGGLERSHA